jgi:peptidoglycan/LPS O-acetylase OafA/YrhL
MSLAFAPDGRSGHLRLKALDAIRIFGCYAIVCYHFTPYIDGGDGWFFWPLRNASVLVDVFFVISGVVIAHNYDGRTGTFSSYWNYLRKRFARLYPLHLATLLFYSVIGLAALGGYLQVSSGRKYDFSEWIPNVLMVHAWGFSADTAFNYPSWTISAEMFAYMLFPLVFAVATRSVLASLGLVVAVFAIAVVVSELWVGRHLAHLTVPYSIFRALAGFSVGVVLYANRHRFPDWRPVTVRALFCASLIVMLVLMIGGGNSYLILASAVAFAAMAFVADHHSVALGFGGAGTSQHAELTYSLYMLHAPVATVFLAFVFPKVLGGSFDSLAVRVACVVASIVIAVALSWASYRYFEVPARKMITGPARLPGLSRQPAEIAS